MPFNHHGSPSGTHRGPLPGIHDGSQGNLSFEEGSCYPVGHPLHNHPPGHPWHKPPGSMTQQDETTNSGQQDGAHYPVGHPLHNHPPGHPWHRPKSESSQVPTVNDNRNGGKDNNTNDDQNTGLSRNPANNTNTGNDQNTENDNNVGNSLNSGNNSNTENGQNTGNDTNAGNNLSTANDNNDGNDQNTGNSQNPGSIINTENVQNTDNNQNASNNAVSSTNERLVQGINSGMFNNLFPGVDIASLSEEELKVIKEELSTYVTRGLVNYYENQLTGESVENVEDAGDPNDIDIRFKTKK